MYNYPLGLTLMTNRGVDRDIHSSTLVLDDLLDIQLFVDISAGLGGDKWPAATGMCKLISANAAFFGASLFSKGMTVLELGAGTGFNLLHPMIVVKSVFSLSF